MSTRAKSWAACVMRPPSGTKRHMYNTSGRCAWCGLTKLEARRRAAKLKPTPEELAQQQTAMDQKMKEVNERVKEGLKRIFNM